MMLLSLCRITEISRNKKKAWFYVKKLPQPGLTGEKVRLVWLVSGAWGALLVFLGTLGGKKRGIKILGIYLGSEGFQKQNWKRVLDKVEAKLSKWKWLLPQLSYRGRALIVNNLVASCLWHRLTVLVPPPGFVKEVQQLTCTSLWQREDKDL